MKTAITLNQRAEAATQALPPLLVEAERVAATVIMGIHGRKRAGPGESFWQYRPYSFGDSVQRIDWRKSARADRILIRENEWEAANTLWLWPSPAKTMEFKSHLATVTKRERAELITLALGALALRAHERVGALGSPLAPGHARSSLIRVAEWLLLKQGGATPAALPVQRFSTVIAAGDFLAPIEETTTAVTRLAATGARGHMVQIVDPAEETLPYDGRVEFLGLGERLRFVAGKTQSLRDAYQERFKAHREALRSLAGRVGWTFTVHHTDQSPSRLLMQLHVLIGGERSRLAAGA
jgi:uncharacterized protein (DUF58 family)